MKMTISKRALRPTPQVIDDLLDQTRLVLRPKAFDALMRTLDSPRPAGPRLKALMAKAPLWRR